MKTAIIAPYSSKLPDGKRNPKDWHDWVPFITLMKNAGYYIIQIGTSGEAKLDGVNEHRLNLSFLELEGLLRDNPFSKKTIISVDSFLPHFCAYHKIAPIHVVWGQSDYKIFGYPIHNNITKDYPNYLRPGKEQYFLWTMCEYKEEAFPTAQEVMDKIVLDNP
jgi:hypothetical protein